MPTPRVSSMTQEIRRAFSFYRMCAMITGVLLLLLTAEMIFKYFFALEWEAFGRGQFLGLVPRGTVVGLNLSTGILIVHGWFFVLYLISDMRLFSAMGWPLRKFLLIALGGVVPVLSFVLERRVRLEVDAKIGHGETAEAEAQAQAETQAEAETEPQAEAQAQTEFATATSAAGASVAESVPSEEAQGTHALDQRQSGAHS